MTEKYEKIKSQKRQKHADRAILAKAMLYLVVLAEVSAININQVFPLALLQLSTKFHEIQLNGVFFFIYNLAKS